jgi:magnesium transporter
MLEIYKTNKMNKLETVTDITKGCWINLVSPSEQEIQFVADHANVPVDFIKDALDDEERSRIEKEEGDVFIIIDYPYISKDESGYSVYETLPLGIILTNECIITISLKDAQVLMDFKNNKKKEFYTFKKTRFALQILFVISSYYLTLLETN